MTAIHTPNGQLAGASAFRVTPPFVRSGPWISDGIWIAHASTGIFAALAKELPLNGKYGVGQGNGIHRIGDVEPDFLQNHITNLDTITTPVTLTGPELETAVDENQITTDMLDQWLEALTADGHRWVFDANIVHGTRHNHRWTWTVSTVYPVAVLIGRDHRNRIRFAVAELIQPPQVTL